MEQQQRNSAFFCVERFVAYFSFLLCPSNIVARNLVTDQMAGM
jgi:hypothetical protein